MATRSWPRTTVVRTTRTLLEVEDTNDGCHRTQIVTIGPADGVDDCRLPLRSRERRRSPGHGRRRRNLVIRDPSRASPTIRMGLRCRTLQQPGDAGLSTGHRFCCSSGANAATDEAQLHFLFQTRDGGLTWTTSALPAGQLPVPRSRPGVGARPPDTLDGGRRPNLVSSKNSQLGWGF